MTGWLKTAEIREHLGISSNTINKWIDKYAMPAHRLGRLWNFQKYTKSTDGVKACGAANRNNKDSEE